MNKRERFYPGQPPWGRQLAVAALMVFLAGMSGPVAAVMLDDFSTDQNEIIDNTLNSTPVTSTAIGVGIIGGSRFISVNLLQSTNPVSRTVSASVASGTYGNSYDTSALGQSRIVWAGGNDPDTGYMAPPVNLCTGDRFVLRYAGNDQPMVGSYVLRVYSPGGGWSYHPFNVPDDSTWGAASYDVSLPFSTFTVGGGGGANFCNVGRIDLFWDTLNMPVPQDDLDVQIDYIQVPDEVSYTCTSKTFATGAPLNLGPAQFITYPETTTFPQTVTAQVSFTVGADADIQPDALTITDTLDAGFTYVGPTNQTAGPAGAIVAPDSVVGQVVTWKNKVRLPAGSVVTFQYGVQVNEPPALPDPPTYRRNRVRLQVAGLPVNEPLICSAGINQQPPPSFTCAGKTFATGAPFNLGPAQYLTYPDTATFPQTVTAAVTFTNTGAFAIDPGVLTITDTLEAGFSYVAGSTSSNPAGIIVGDPGGSPGPVLTWTNAAAIPPGQTVVLSYQVTVAEPPALPDPPNYRQNQVLLQAPAATPSQCGAGINQQPLIPPEYTCNSKTLESTSLSLGPAQLITFPDGTTFPQDVTAAVTFTNTSATVTIPAGALTIRDTLDAGLTYLGPTTQTSSPAGTIVDPPDSVVGQVVTWTNKQPIPPSRQVRFAYPLRITNLTVGTYVGNNVALQVSSYPESNCFARATVASAPGEAPGVNPLGMLIAALMLALTAVFAYRRRSL